MLTDRNGFARPLHMSEFEFAVDGQAPRAGEHTDTVLSEAGYSAAESAGLRSAGVIG